PVWRGSQGRRFDEGAVRPPAGDPRTEADQEDVRDDRRDVEIGKRDETREDRVGAAQQRAEDEQKRRDDEREAKRGPRASDRAGATVAGEQLAQREWHDPARRRQHDRQAGPQCVTKTGRGDGLGVLAVLRREAGVSGSRHEKHFTTQSKFAQGPVVPWPRAVTERRARPYRSRVVPRAHRANSFRGVAAQTIL